MTGIVKAVADLGEGPGGPPPPPLLLGQTDARRAEKKIWDAAPPYLRVWMTPTPPVLLTIKISFSSNFKFSGNYQSNIYS